MYEINQYRDAYIEVQLHCLEKISTHANLRFCFNVSQFSNIFSVPLTVLNCPQVLDGAGLDVDFLISSPSGQVLYSDYRKSDGVHT